MNNKDKQTQLHQHHPMSITNREQRRSNVQSATYRNNDVRKRGATIAITGSSDLNQRIANQLKKIGPDDLVHKSIEGLNKKNTHAHTLSSGDYIKQYHDYNVGANPEISDRLDQLTEKINLLEFRQKKMQSKNKNTPTQNHIQTLKQSKTMKVLPKSATQKTQDASKAVIKQLKTVKDEIKQLKQIMHIIQENKQEENIKTQKDKQADEKFYDPHRLTRSAVKINKQPFGLRNIQTAGRFRQKQQQKHTIYFNSKITSASNKNISLPYDKSPEEVEFEATSKSFKKSNRKIKLNSGKISTIPTGLSKKRFRVAKSATKKNLVSPYIQDVVRPKSKGYHTKSNFRKSLPQNNDHISVIEDNFQGQDLQKKMVIMPKLPEGFNPILNSEQLLKLAKKIMLAFNVVSDWSEPINIKKYKNCVFFNHIKTNVLWHYDGKFYIGGWSEDKEGSKQGYGVESIPEKYIYQGQFRKGKRSGFGVMNSYNDEYYRGNWVNGYRHGKGRLQEPSGCVYQGEWIQGKKEGFGKLIFSKKQYYEGMFKGGLKNGLGKQLLKNGDAYQGQYLNGRFNGQGIYRWANGATYNGDFRDGRRHGKGTWIANDSVQSDLYEGQYQNDSKSGKGRYNWANGSIYVGQFSNDQKNGQGVIYYNDGKVLQGIWSGDQIVKKLYSQKPRHSKIKK